MSNKQKNKFKRELLEVRDELAREKKKNAFLLHEIKMLINDLDNTELTLADTPSILKRQAQ